MMPQLNLECRQCGARAFFLAARHGSAGRTQNERAAQAAGWVFLDFDTGIRVTYCSKACCETFVQKEVGHLINATRGWNEGHGLIVPPALAEELRKRGFTEGFTETRPLPKE